MWRVSIEKRGLGAEDCIVRISMPYFSYTQFDLSRRSLCFHKSN